MKGFQAPVLDLAMSWNRLGIDFGTVCGSITFWRHPKTMHVGDPTLNSHIVNILPKQKPSGVWMIFVDWNSHPILEGACWIQWYTI